MKTQTYNEMVDYTIDHARTVFDKHRIIRERYGLWYCGEKGTSAYSFRVMVGPGALIAYGDIGELILRPHALNALQWAYACSWRPDQPYYPLTKVAPNMREKEFYPGDATAWAREMVEDTKDEDEEYRGPYVEILNTWLERDHSENPIFLERDWYEICVDARLDDPPSFRAWSHGVLWMYQALCWFMTHVHHDDPRFKEELCGKS